MKKQKSFLLISALMLLLPAFLYAYNVTGRVIDISGEPMIQASVRLLSTRDSAILRADVTNTDGYFKLQNVNNGRFILETSYVGYDSQYKNIEVKGKNLNIDSIVMRENTILLKEAVVTGIKTPVKVMEDTIEFNADSYKTQPNAVVEDLLKRLPGVEVSSEGKITANGKEVTKILVDGKEFFSDDPKVASKNLPVNMVEKLQVVDRKSDLARITGVDDGEEETVINLTVKKGMKNGWFGTIEGGYGTDNRYRGQFNVNRFWNDNQITFIGGANNVNDMSFTDGGSRFRRFGGNNGITTSQAFGVNFNVGNKEIFRVGGDVMYTHTDRDTRTKSSTEYFLENGSRWQNNEKNSRDKGHNFRADFRVQWKPDSFNTLDFRPNISLNYNDSHSSQYSDVAMGLTSDNAGFTNQSWNRQLSHGTSTELGAELIYNHSFRSHPGRSFSVQGRIRTSNVREKENALTWIKYYLTDAINEDPYDYFSDNHTWSNTLSGRLTWTEPIGNAKNGNFLEFSYNMQYRWNNADKLTYDRDISGITLGQIDENLPLWTLDLIPGDVLIDSLSNRFRNDYMNQDIRVGYKYVSKAHNLNVGLSLVPQMSRSLNLIDDAKSIPERWVWNVAPYMRYRLKLSQSRSFNINYRGRSSQPSMNQLQPVADYSDPLNVVQGNPELLPSFTHNINFRFQDFNQQAQRSIMAMLMANVTQNSIISKTTFTENGGRFTTYENVNGIWRVNAFTMMSFPFRNKFFTFNNFFNIGYSHDVGYNNGNRNNAGNLNVGESFGIAWRPDNLELELRPEYRLQYSNNSLTSRSNSTIHSYGGSFNGTYYAPFGLVLSTNLRYSANHGYGEGYNKNELLWNASLSYQMLRDRSLTLSLNAYDLLNQRSNIQRQVTGNYTMDSMYNSLGRYVMFTVAYRFTTFSKGQEPEGRGDSRFGGPGGPPPGAPRRGAGGPPPGGRPPM